MINEKIAILTDSGSDVPVYLLKKFHIYELPLGINYKDHSYKDRVDITPEEVYSNLGKEIPKTSLPTVGEVHAKLNEIIADGYTHVIIPLLSSELSGTYQTVKMVCTEFTQIKTAVIDTKNIALASGFFSIYASELIAQGLDFDEIVSKLESKITKSHIYYSLETLQYLVKGGRLGRVEGMLGSILQIKPIIACDENGIYHTVEKVRGRKKSISKTIEIVENGLKNTKKYYLAISHGAAPEEAERVMELMKSSIDGAEMFMSGQISASLGVHTGPGLVGIGYFELD